LLWLVEERIFPFCYNFKIWLLADQNTMSAQV
jgi:hypothetical protein